MNLISYVVPFGDHNRVAIMSMSRISPSMTVLEEWLTVQTELDLKECQVLLIPILHPCVVDRLSSSAT